MKHLGIMVIVNQPCVTSGDDAYVSRSQPMALRSKYPAENVLHFAVLMAGASITKVLLVFKYVHHNKYFFSCNLKCFH